jgi:SET domain-containing protein
MANLQSKLLEHLKNDVYCKLGVSTVHGIGVFALKQIPAGVTPLRTLRGHREIKVSVEELKKLPKALRNHIEAFCYTDGDTVLIPTSGLNSMDMAVYLNHSKRPNLRFLGDGRLVSLRAIRPGEELFIDYDESFGEVHRFE